MRTLIQICRGRNEHIGTEHVLGLVVTSIFDGLACTKHINRERKRISSHENPEQERGVIN